MPQATAATVLAGTFACGPALAEVLEARARVRGYRARSVIVAGDQVFDAVHVLIDGRARTLAFAVDGRLVAVEDFGIGDLFGETGLFEPARAPHDIAAVEDSRTAAFANAVFVELMSAHSAVAIAVSQRLVARLGKVTRRMVEGATLSATGRIHAELLRQAEAGEAMTISPPPVLSQFALLVQSTRETVSRTISTLEKRGIIARDEQGLRIVAPHRLQELIY